MKFAWIAAVCAVLAACSPRAEVAPAPAPAPATVSAPARVFAAASLADVLNDAADAYAAKGGARPVFNTASSSALARQIEQGAEADLFLSADAEWVDYLDQRGLVAAGTRKALAGNELVLAVPASAGDVRVTLQGLPALPAGERLAIGDPESVPAGRYAREAMTAAGVWDAMKDRLVLGDSVRAALAHVESGEAAAGIVYRTDVLAAKDKVRAAEVIDANLHAPIVYWMAGVERAGADKEAASTFAGFLTSPEGQALFAARGFAAAP